MKRNLLKLNIFYTNDTHSYLGNFAKRAELLDMRIEASKKENRESVVLDAGDVISGGDVYYNMYNGAKEAELLSRLNYDAVTFGNHEFDGGSNMLTYYLDKLSIPLIATNVDCSGDQELKKYVDDETIIPYMIRRFDSGEEVGIFSLTTETTVEVGFPSKDIEFKDSFKTAKEMVNFFNDKGITAVVCLSHLGYDIDRELAEEVPGISAIVGGHTHTVLEHPVMVKGTAIVQAGCYGKYLGELQIDIDKTTGRAYSVEGELHDLDEFLEENSEIKEIIDQLRDEKEAYTSKVIASSKEALPGEKIDLELSTTPLGSLVADAYFYEGQIKGFQPDFAIINSGGVRTGLPEGEITRGDILKILPFSKQLMIMEVTGKELLESLEYGLYPQVSGLELIYNMKNEPGQRLVDAFVNGQEVDPDKLYTMATNSFVGMGKDFYTGFKDAIVIDANVALDADLLADYLKSLPQPITYDVERRIKYI